jgi:thiosulfate/3-mercaptopyruvate sulfurtransferase
MTFANPHYLVQTDWLAHNLDDGNLRILDVTAKLTPKLENTAEQEHFHQGHIPGSVFFDVASAKGVLSDKNARLPWTWPPVARFEATMGEFGVSNQDHVIIVARTPREGLDSGTMWCTRAWWTMHHFGVRCSILEGGIEKWEAEGRPLTTDIAKPVTAQFTAAANYAAGLANKDDVLASLSDSSTCLVDALPESTFNGTDQGYGPRKGHIDGAINVPFHSLIRSETALFKNADELADELAPLLGEQKVLTYCGAAIAATVDAFALKLLGHEDVRVYDGSLLEWSADESLPMCTCTTKH